MAAIGEERTQCRVLFNDIDVPAYTLASFAVAPLDASKAVSSEFKKMPETWYFWLPKYDENNLPDFDSLKTAL